MLALPLALLLACGDTSPAEPPATAPPPEAPAEAPAKAPDTAGPLVSGTITAPDGAPEAKAVFVSLRVPGRRGPPLAAKKLPPGPFPLPFTLTEADRPMANGPIPDAFELKATLDIDGNPMAKSPDDLEVVVSTTKGSSDVVVALAPRE